MRNLLLNSFILLLLSGCTLGNYKQLQVKTAGTREIPTSLFGENFNSFLFKTNLRIYGHDFSGLLVTKQLEPRTYRVIFTTELGMKLFDFEFKDTSFSIKSCIPQFNRPKLLKLIKHDIELLLMNFPPEQVYDRLYDAKDSMNVYRYAFGKNKVYYYYGENSAELRKIEEAKKQVKKINFVLSDVENNFPKHIFIHHYDVKLTIELQLLKH